MAKPTRSTVYVSDTHCGCKLGLCPPEKIRVDDGGWYRPSEFQEQMWSLWCEFWDEWVPFHTKGEPYDIVHNGDAIEGVHHKATTPISHNIKDQQRIAFSALRPRVEKCKKMGGKFFHIRGTEAHVGTSGVYEEELAESLGAKPDEDGKYARYELWKRVGTKEGPLVHSLHHIGTTGSAAHEASAVNAELTAMYVEAARWRHEPPDFIIRSHRHRSIAVDIDSANGYAAAIVTPCWQGKTPFTWKIPGARISQPQFGGVMVKQGESHNYYLRKVWGIGRSKEE